MLFIITGLAETGTQAKTVKFCIQEELLKRWNKDKDEWGLNGNQYELSVVPCSNQQNAVSFTYR